MKQILKYKTPLLVAVFLAIVLGAYFLREKWLPFFTKEEGTPIPAPKDSSTTITNVVTPKVVENGTRVLQIGDHGDEVRQLQQMLLEDQKSFGSLLLPITADGNFGKKTQDVLYSLTNRQGRGVKVISLNEYKAHYRW